MYQYVYIYIYIHLYDDDLFSVYSHLALLHHFASPLQWRGTIHSVTLSHLPYRTLDQFLDSRSWLFFSNNSLVYRQNRIHLSVFPSTWWWFQMCSQYFLCNSHSKNMICSPRPKNDHFPPQKIWGGWIRPIYQKQGIFFHPQVTKPWIAIECSKNEGPTQAETTRRWIFFHTEDHPANW